MGGKSSNSTQQIQIPPEVLARYNAVNARAETTAQTPFQQYSTNPADFVAPLTSSQQAGIANTNYYAGTAQPYYQAATGQLAEAQQAAVPYYGQATQNVGQAQAVGSNLAGSSLDALAGAFGASSPYYAQANQNIGGAQNAGNMLAYGSLGALGGASAAANPLQQQAQAGLAGAYAGAQPFNLAAANQYFSGLQQGQDLSQQAYGSGRQALRGAQPFQGMASQYMQAGAQAVNPNALGAEQINQYMSPYLSNVLQGTAALQNQMNQQAMSGQTGNAIRSGAFGGDRAGIAAANLAQQQQIANSKIFSDILNQGYGQALGTAQQQQQLGLSAEQANRAALQQASQQALGIGQQGFGQGMAAAQQQQQLAQQLYGMGSGAGQNLAALGQQVYGQRANTAQQQAALASQLFGQGATTAQQMAQLGQQQFGQGMTAAQQQAQMGQQMFGQGSTAAQQLAALGQQQFGQGITAAQQQAALGAGLFGMGSQTAQGLANLGIGAQAAGLQGAQAQIAAGLGQQQTEQAGLQALYNQFLQQQSYPFQTAQFLANIAMGTGALSGSTTTTNQVLSDKRLKENIKPIGKTFDGQNIYSYNFKGDPRTEIGLIAQEVEKRHPEAIGLAGGYRTVNYDKATDEAADRGHFAYGGSAMGGGVMPQHAGEGFYDGGYVGFDPALMQQILASYQQMYAPMQNQKGGLGAVGYVPEASGSVGQLMTAGALPDMPNPIASAKGIAELGTGLGELGGNLNFWDYTDEQRAETARKKKAKEAEGHAYGGLAAGRHGYEEGGETGNEIVVMGKRATPAPAPAPKQIEVPSATPAPAPLAPVAKVDTSKTVSKPSFQKVGLDIPQIANTVGLTPAAALTPLKDSTGDILSGIGSIGNAVGSIMAASDRRLKENIKPVGKTFDGQTVYSYNYKGDPQTRMGLIAQEVAKHHPDAVHKVGGYGAVDYKKATGDAAHRGHFAFGGSPDDEDTGTPGLNIPTEGNKVGLAGAPGLTPLKDSTGDILSGLGSIGQAAAKIMKKAAGGGASHFNPMFDEIWEDVDPSEIVAGGREGMDPLNISPNRAGLAAATEIAPRKSPMQITSERGSATSEPPSGLAPRPTSAPTSPAISSKVTSRNNGAPRSIRNNNPGNIEDGAFARKLPGYAGSDGRFAVFKAPEYGRDAQIALINSYIKRGYDTPAEIANRWAPGAEAGNNPNSYASAIAKRLGIGVNDRVPASGIPLIADAQTIVEGGPKALQHFSGGYANGGLAGGRHGYEDGGPPTAAAPTTLEEDFDATFGKKKPSGLAAAAETPAAAPSAIPAQQVADAKSSLPATDAAAAPAKPKSRGLLSEIAHGDFISGLGKGRATSWIPLLTGIGASLSGPYRGVVGLGQGIAAGAQAAQAQREFGLQREKAGYQGRAVGVAEARLPIDALSAIAAANTAVATGASSWRDIAQSAYEKIMAAGGPGKDPTNDAIYRYAQSKISGAASNDLIPQAMSLAGRGKPGEALPQGGIAPENVGLPPKLEDIDWANLTIPKALDIKKQYEFARLPTGTLDRWIEQAYAGQVPTATGVKPTEGSTGVISARAGAETSGAETAAMNLRKYSEVNETSQNWDANGARNIAQSLQSVASGTPPPPDLLVKVEEFITRAKGWTPDQARKVFGDQTTVAGVLQGARAAGFNVDPSMGASGLTVLAGNLLRQDRIIAVDNAAAKAFVQKYNGQYPGGLNALIDDTRKANRQFIETGRVK